jgi:hypothetical protein
MVSYDFHTPFNDFFDGMRLYLLIATRLFFQGGADSPNQQLAVKVLHRSGLLHRLSHRLCCRRSRPLHAVSWSPEHGLAEKVVVCAHANPDPNKQKPRLDSFWYEVAQNFKSLQIFKTKIKKSKTYAIDDFLRPIQ